MSIKIKENKEKTKKRINTDTQTKNEKNATNKQILIHSFHMNDNSLYNSMVGNGYFQKKIQITKIISRRRKIKSE